ncbi:hypothetical protein [Winogradskyella sp.]|jgi:hypothetical protein|uniref:hypothetical protein n=1 Tax=Winogradskyella sp. TaxID=1883156 RepID=UPI0025FE2C30|nr:hypothetical protein [Winogradskyella sp.]MCT4629588.1 hypothetical protein [Winogradskyella sp.]
MGGTAIEILYNQIIFFTNKETFVLKNYGYIIFETHKGSGKPISEIYKIFKRFIEIGFLSNNKSDDESYITDINYSLEMIRSKIDE